MDFLALSAANLGGQLVARDVRQRSLNRRFQLLDRARKQLYKNSEICLLQLYFVSPSANGKETVPFRTCTRQLYPPATVSCMSTLCAI